jgi:dsRNA-specific ribonuclease
LTLINKVSGSFHFERTEFIGDAVAKFIQSYIILVNFPKLGVNINTHFLQQYCTDQKLREFLKNDDAMNWLVEITGLTKQIDPNNVFQFRGTKWMADALEVWTNEEYERNEVGWVRQVSEPVWVD